MQASWHAACVPLGVEASGDSIPACGKVEEGLRQSDARQLVSHDEVKKQFLS
jgi:hypothetical protein